MKTVMQKLLCCILTIITVFSAGSVILFASAEEAYVRTGKEPVIYIIGRTAVFTASGDVAFKGESNNALTEAITACVPYLKDALLKNEWDAYYDAIYNNISPFFEEYKLSDDGEITNGSDIHWHWNYDSLPAQQSGNIYDYAFYYDCRRDPLAIADDLKAYIDAVLEKTGQTKFHLVSRCLGCNMAAAYLAKYPAEHDKILTNVMFASGATGYDFIGEMFAGKFKFDADAINRYMVGEGHINDFIGGFDATVKEFIMAGIAMLDEMNILDLGLLAADVIADKVVENVLPELMLATYGTCPGYWSMVNDENYEDAKTAIFGEQASGKYKNLVEKIDNYHYNVSNKLSEILLDMKQDGTNMGILCKYGFQTMPVIEGADEVGDNRIEVVEQSFGATTAFMDGTFSNYYMWKAEKNGTAKYISPDRLIDSSTALFPDYTWYVKNLLHNPFPDCFNPLMLSICHSEEQMTVNSNPAYPQYLLYENDSVTPLTSENMNTIIYTDNFFDALKRFWTALFALIKLGFSKIENR